MSGERKTGIGLAVRGAIDRDAFFTVHFAVQCANLKVRIRSRKSAKKGGG